MKTSRTLRLIRSWILALMVAGASTALPSALPASGPVRLAAPAIQAEVSSAQLTAPVLPAAWYDQILNSRSRTIQAVFILVLIGAFMLRRSS